MSIKIYRQNTTSSTIAPPSLQYGMISCDKSGCLYVGDSSNNVVEQMNVVKYQEVGNPNLLDNSDFTNPVNQRSAGSYSGTGIYGIDRWKLWGGYNVSSHTLTFQSANAVSAAGLSACLLMQRITGIVVGDTVTLSTSVNGTAYIKTVTTTGSETAYNMGSFYFICGYTSDSAFFEIAITSGSISVEWMKVEKGSVSTPYVPKGYGVELAECLRYYQKIFVDWRTYPPLNGLIYRIPMTTLQIMRTSPTITKTIEPYTFGCDITGMNALTTGFAVQVTVNQTGLNSGAAALSGYFSLAADL